MYAGHDLPDRFDPVTVKELRQNLRRTSFVVPFLGVHALAAVALGAELFGGAGASGFGGPLRVFTSGPLWILIAMVCIVILPLGGLVMMGEELDEGNHELLQLTRVPRWRVVLGKWLTLWGLSAVTMISLLPYVVVRFLIGGIEWWHEASCGAATLGGAALVGAGAIGASSFRNMGARTGAFLLYLASAAVGCGIPVALAAAIFGSSGFYLHFTTAAAVVCYSVIGLALARARMRLVFLSYETNPTGMLIGILVFAPFFIGLVTALSVGFGGWVGLGLTALIAARIDVSPKGPAATART